MVYEIGGKGKSGGKEGVATAGEKGYPFGVDRVYGEQESGDKGGPAVFSEAVGEEVRQQCVDGVKDKVQQMHQQWGEAVQTLFDKEREEGQRSIVGGNFGVPCGIDDVDKVKG